MFTIPRALRQLFARERPLLGLLPRRAFAAVRRSLRERAGLRDRAPRFVASIQTFGALLPFHPHVHALATDGLFLRDGTFVAVDPDPRAVEELFRRLVIKAHRKAERLPREFAEGLLEWEHSGFSVYAEQVVFKDERERLARLARYIARARRKSRARLMRRILEVDPLLCPDCGAEMRVVSVITDIEVVDRILDHLERRGHDARAPPDP